MVYLGKTNIHSRIQQRSKDPTNHTSCLTKWCEWGSFQQDYEAKKKINPSFLKCKMPRHFDKISFFPDIACNSLTIPWPWKNLNSLTRMNPGFCDKGFGIFNRGFRTFTKVPSFYSQDLTLHSSHILTDKRNATTKIKVILFRHYVEINQQNLLKVSCVEGISTFVQRYHQTGVNQGRNLTSRMPSFSSNFQKTRAHWKIKNEWDNG